MRVWRQERLLQALLDVLLCCVLVGSGAVTSSASAEQLSHSRPIALDRDGAPQNLINVVSCPASTQCTAVDANGAEVTFDPASGTVNRAGVLSVDPGGGLNSVSCPTATQCTAVDGYGGEVTFDPTTGTVNRAGIKSIEPPPSRPSIPGGLDEVSCPSTTQCTAVDANGAEVTFDSTSGRVNRAGLKYPDGNGDLSSVSCPAVTQCTGVDGNGGEVTFDPASGRANRAGVKSIELTNPATLSCPSATQCTAAGNGEEATFDPSSGTVNRAGVKLIGPRGVFLLNSVSCPSVAQCTAVDPSDGGEVTFDPTSGTINHAGVTSVAPSYLTSVSCPAATLCTAIDGYGGEVTFDPTTGTVNRAGIKSIDPPPTPAPPAISVTTEAATAVGSGTATLHGLIDTRGHAASSMFQYGTSTRYKNATPIHTITAGHGQSGRVSFTLRALAPGTTYHFRLLARISPSAHGAPVTTHGQDLRFTTRPQELRVSRGLVEFPLRCAHRRACRGRLSISIRARVGRHHRLAPVLCASTHIKIRAGKTDRVKTRIYAGCLSALRHAARRRIAAKLTARFRTGQQTIINIVILAL